MIRALLAACAIALVAALPAHAATYTVSACTASDGSGVNNSWTTFAQGSVSVPYGNACVAGRGLPNDINQSVSQYAGDGLELTAPAGAAVVSLSATYQAAWDGGNWGAQVDDTRSVVWCPVMGSSPCGQYPSAFWWWDFFGPVTLTASGSWQTLRLDGWCLAAGGCQGHLQSAWRKVSVTISKTTSPALTLGAAPTTPVSGTQQLAWSATDSTGIRRARLYVDGALASDQLEPCDYTYVAPCESQAASFAVDTTKLADGPHTYAVEVRDATDVNAATKSGSFYVSNAVPGQPRISPPTGTHGWLNAAEASVYSPRLSVPSGGPPIAAYAVTAGATTVTVNAAADGSATVSAPSGGWPQGTDTIEARAISTSGVESAPAALTFSVDATPPSVTAEGYGAAAPAWQPAPVSVRLVATDPLSGVGGADDTEPVTNGAYIAYTVDTGARQTERGGTATVILGSQGQHWITFQAYDLAGNVSQSRTVYVNVGSPSAGAAPATAFWARSVNPRSTFTAAAGFGTPCPASATLTATRDTYVDEGQPDQTFATATSLVVRSAQGADARALLDFSLPPAGGCAVTSATLRLYSTAGTPGRTLAVLRAGSPWTDSTADWSNRPGATGTAATAPASPAGWQQFDVTSQIQDAYSYGDDGLVVRDAAEGAAPAAGQAFGSSEGPAEERPQLVVTFG